MEQLLGCLPSEHDVECLVEPFVGSASVFMNTTYRQYVMADANADLIAVYHCTRDNPSLLIAHLKKLWAAGQGERIYLENRQAFNILSSGVEKSALFIWLNRHGFNGVCRYNKKGEFNVPYGRPACARLPEQDILNFARKAERCHVTFFHADFAQTLKVVTEGMFSALRCGVYCDPPYLPHQSGNVFTSYTRNGFDAAAHRRLAAVLHQLNTRNGIPVVVSGSDTMLSREIYRDFQFSELTVRRSVSARGESRSHASEIICQLPGRNINNISGF